MYWKFKIDLNIREKWINKTDYYNLHAIYIYYIKQIIYEIQASVEKL